MGVTAFRQINNNSTQTITLINHENSSNTVTVKPNTIVGIEVWIPWCVSTGDFKWNHYLEVAKTVYNTGIAINHGLCVIWQKDNQVCYSTDLQFHDPGTAIPGVCAINGDRLLTINGDLTISVSVV